MYISPSYNRSNISLSKFTPVDILSQYAAISPINANFAQIATVLDDCVSRSGVSPNEMEHDLDLNGFSITNLGAPAGPTDAVRLSDIEELIAANGNITATLATSVGAAMIGSTAGTVQSDINSIKASITSLEVQSNGWADLKSDFGALGDGTTDDTLAIQAWLAAGVAGSALFAPAGTYIFTSSISAANPTGLVIQGAGRFATVFKYTGASTTADLFSFGTIGSTATKNMSLTNFRITSGTTMTGGAGLHLKNVVRSDVKGVVMDGQDGNGKLYNGIWFDQIDIVTYTDFLASASNDCLRVNGGVGATAKADLFIHNGKITPSDSTTSVCGIRVGGAFGGLLIGALDVIGCNTNMIVDTSLAAESNREISFSALAALDTSVVGPNLLLNDGGTGTLYVSAAGAWFASAKTNNIQINNTTCNYNVVITGGRIYNSLGGGLLNSSSIADITITGTEIRANTGTGVDNTGAGSVKLSNPRFASNGLNTTSNVFVDGTPLTVTVANGSNAVLNMNAGLLTACLTNGGNSVGVYACGQGAAVLLGSSASTWVASTTTPAAGKASIAYNGSAFAVYNNTGASVTFSYSAVNLNSGH